MSANLAGGFRFSNFRYISSLDSSA